MSLNKDWALIIHADSSGTRVDIYWVDIRAGRLGLALAREVKAWRRRDDLLTLGQRFRIVDGPSFTDQRENVEPHQANEEPEQDIIRVDPTHDSPATPDVPGLPPVVPQDRRRADSRHQWLRGRVAAVLAHSDTAGMALQRAWPQGIPGLKSDGHSMDDLDAIQSVVERVEANHSVPFYPPWDDPDIERSIQHHPAFSDRWARPDLVKDAPSSKESVEARLSIQEAIMQHPRRALLSSWVSHAIRGGVDHNVDTTALAHALFEFAKVDEAEWPDEDVTTMLDASLRTLGYMNGLADLGHFNPLHAPLLMSAAFAIVAGNAVLAFGEDGVPTLVTDYVGKPL